MKIDKFKMSRLRNNAYYQFHTEFLELLIKHGLKIEPHIEAYKNIYYELGEAINRINKSIITSLIEDSDKARSKIWRGLVNAALSFIYHFNPEKKAAAEKLKLLFDAYGNISQKSFNEQTALFGNILQELRGKYAKDVAELGVEEWVSELEARNADFDMLMKKRYKESAEKCSTVVKKARVELDKLYYVFTDCINAFALLENGERYDDFIRTLNAVVAKYSPTAKITLPEPEAQTE